jgi:hypothetical protein
VKRLAYWLPRLLVLGSAAAVLLPTPAYVRGLSEDAFLVWLARVGWVLFLSLGLGAVFWVAGRLKRK